MINKPFGLPVYCEFCVEKLSSASFFNGIPCCSKCWNTIRDLKQFERSKKEATTMQVSYNGFTGELVKLEKKEDDRRVVITTTDALCGGRPVKLECYDLSIYDREKQVTHSFTGVNLDDVKFLGGAVSFDG